MNAPHAIALPNEILLAVIEAAYEPALVWEADEPADPDPANQYLVLKAICNLCLVSRWFRSAAQPIMYREFSLGYGQNWRPAPWGSWVGRWAALVTTLAARPDLAGQLRRAYIHRSLIDAVNEEEFATGVEHAKRALSITLPDDQLPWDKSELLHFLTLSLMPNLEHLAMQPPNGNADTLGMADWVTLDLGPKTGFRKLRSAEFISFGSSWSFHPVRSSSAGKWELPKLTLRREFSAPHVHTVVTGVKDLRIVEAHVSAETISELLGPLPGSQPFTADLNRFYFASTPEEDPFTFNRAIHFSSHQLISALSVHRGTLRHLHLDMSQVSNFFEDSEIITLEDLPVLETLAISPGCIDRSGNKPNEWLSRLLPPSLRRLSILRDWFLVPEPTLASLCDAIRSGRFPQLKEIRCSASTYKHYKSGIQRIPSKTLKHLERAFGEVGVKFGTISERNARWLQLRLDRIVEDLERGPPPSFEDEDDDI
ncbi:hypothetical protein B0T14DRAFT_569731 [Immersiella caudata]|uniref:F-box domain-containing protein n=1 Tax=Immersiella caudata TaxID=314043 RepID=A0AA40BU43_9PEZI|nr:hypothetical protein B0T14DRAFT_569731 [Immersiella caudata]